MLPVLSAGSAVTFVDDPARREGGGVRIVVAFPLPKEQEGDG